MIMSNYTVDIPNYTIGPDAISSLQSVAEKHGDRALVVGGKTALEKSEEKIVKTLKKSGKTDFHICWYGGECSYENIDMLIGEAKKKRSNLIIGVGGGKALDTAKGLAEKLKLPIITIPTIASTCAAATALSIVYKQNSFFDTLLRWIANSLFINHRTVSLLIQ